MRRVFIFIVAVVLLCAQGSISALASNQTGYGWDNGEYVLVKN